MQTFVLKISTFALTHLVVLAIWIILALALGIISAQEWS